MKAYRINKLFFPTLFASVSALSGTFKDLNPDYLVKYFNSNIQAKCPMSPVQILDIFKNPNISQTQSDCFVLDRTNVSDIKYVMKPVGGCSPDALHPKLLSISTSMCPSTTATAATNGTKTGAAAGSGITAQDIAQTVIGGAAVAQQYQRNIANQRKEDAKAAKAAPVESSAPKDKSAAEGSTPVVPGTANSAAINTAIASAKPAAPVPQAASAPAATPVASTNEGTTGTVDTEFGNLDAAQAAAKIRDPSIGKALSPEEDARVSAQINEQFKESGTPPLEPVAAAEAAKNLSNTPLAESAVGAASTAGASAVDSAATTAKQTAEQTNEAFIAKLRAELTAGIATGEARMAACMPIGVTCLPPTDANSMSKAVMIFQEVQATLGKYTGSQSTCSTSATTADNLCSLIRSPKAIMVQQLMTLATPLISKMSSASQTCGSTSDISKIAQTGMTLANMACTGVKVVCDNSCKTTTTLLSEMKSKISSVSSSLPKESGVIVSAISAHEKGSVLPKVAQCQKHSADIVQFATQAMGLMLAAQQAKDCKEKLTAGGGTGSGTVTMDEMCKDPTQAQTLVCKCKVDATAAGCPGAVVKTTNKDGGPLVIKGNGSGSQLAGIDAFRQGSGLSSAAKTALGLDSNSAASTAGSALNSNFGDSGVAAATSGAATDARGSLSASGSDDKNKSDSAKDKKFSFGSFGSLGSAIGGFFGGSGSKKSGTSGNFGTEKQIAAAKRQIANEQLRSEISTASGRSNWDKVRTRYVESNSTFIGN